MAEKLTINLAHLFLLSFLILSGCADNGVSEPEIPICDQTGVPSISIALMSGHVSADLSISLDRPGKAIYLTSTEKLNFSGYDDLAAQLQAKNYTGRELSLLCNNSEVKGNLTINNLNPDSTYYIYAASSDIHGTGSDKVLEEEFQAKSNVTVDSYESEYLNRTALFNLYLPDSLVKYPDSDQKYPLMIFLGGHGEVAPAGELNLNRNGSLVRYLDRGFQIPFIVVAPEHVENDWDNEFLKEIMAYAKSHYPVDEDLIVMTGMSGGGIGTWNFATAYPELVDVIVPVSGHGEEDLACNLSDMAIYAFHNDNDPTVEVEGTKKMYWAVNKCTRTKEANMTIFKDEGHNAWVRVYDPANIQWELDPTAKHVNIYDWILAQR